VGLGAVCITLTLAAIRLLQRVEIGRYNESVSELDPTWGLLAGIVVGGFFGWQRSRMLESIWHRGVISALSVFGALFLAILAAPLWHFFQFVGLAALGAASLALGLAGNRWAMRGSQEPGVGSEG
jgi:hypothetical protein